MVLVSTVIDQVKQRYEAVTRGVTDGTNVGTAESSRAQAADEFVGSGSGGLADFLFVVDNSGSMGNEQAALSQAAADFISVITSSGLDFRIGTITTDRQTLRGVGYTADTTQFEQDAVAGTGPNARCCPPHSGMPRTAAARWPVIRGRAPACRW